MKRLFTIMASAALMLTANAQQAGEYIYTDEGKFKITTGENLLSNGDFTQGLADWTNDQGRELKLDTFALMDDEKGGFYIRVNNKDNGSGTGSTLLRSVKVEAGKSYYMAYQVRAEEENVTSNVVMGDNVKNYHNFLFSTSGKWNDETNISIAKQQTFGFNWQTFSYNYTPDNYGFLLVHFCGPYLGTCFDNFVIMETVEVIDDRKTNQLISELQAFVDNPLFPNGHDIILEFIEALRMFVELGDMQGYNEMVALKDEAIKEFLNMNTGDLSAYVPDMTLDNLKTTSANQTSAGAWTITDGLRAVNPSGKTRWAVKSADETAAPFDGNYLQNDIPFGTNNKLYEASVWQTVKNMPAGQYMLRVKVRGYKLTDKAGNRDVEATKGMKVFINGDSTECYPVDDEDAKEFIAYSTVKPNEDIKLGFYLPGSVANHVDIDFTDLRIIGWTQEQTDEYFLGKEIAEAKQALKVVIDSARVLYDNKELIYGKLRLDSAINASQAIYDRKWEIADSLTEEETNLKAEIKKYIGDNATLTTLRNTITEVEAMANEEKYASNKAALIAAAEAAKAFITTLTAENHEVPGFTNEDIKAQTALLHDAMNKAKESTLAADEQYKFMEWAAVADAFFGSTLSTEPIETSSAAALYTETATFGGHDLKGRFAFLNTDMNIYLNPSHGLEVNYAKKNMTTMAITGLKQGDVIVMDWATANKNHNIMIVSANATARLADGTTLQYIKTGKDNANVLPKDNTNGLSGSTRSTITMDADGTLDIYQSSSNSTIYIYYVGISAAGSANGIEEVKNSSLISHPSSTHIYDMQGRKVSKNNLGKGIYIYNGKKLVVK